MPKLSIIIPVYNVEKYVKRSIESALSQGDCEIIVVDDGSTDNSGAICDSFASDNVRVFHTENGGLSAARNKGMCEATGDYICFLDSDDYLDKGAAKYMLSLAESAEADVLICGFYTEYEGKEPKAVICDKWQGNAWDLGERFIDLKRSHLFDSACNKLYKREFLEKISLRFSEGEIFEDTKFNLCLFQSNPKLVISDRCFYHYVQRKNGSITKSYNAKKQNTILSRATELKEYCEARCKEALPFCGIYYFKSLFSSIADTFLPSANVKNRRRKVKDCINEEGYTSALKIAAGAGAEKIILLIAKTKNVSVILLFCYAVYFFKKYIKSII